ncbi:MAG: bifunctional [glutamine synthetase] adenylyltransferase/[glutamine synthetase]-adenylyl-L-tyrosine, partial [Ferruginibacter sp.]
MQRHETTLTELARLGFAELGTARELLDQFPAELVPHFAHAADADQALHCLADLRANAPEQVERLLQSEGGADRLIRVLGASVGLAEFLRRHPEQLDALAEPLAVLAGPDELRADLIDAVDRLDEDAAWNALRVRYRRHICQLAAWDLASPDPLAAVSDVTAMLADLAGAALDASLEVARRSVRFPAEDVARTHLAVIGMGKCGARELNYVSDVDVIFVAEGSEGLPADRAVEIATRLAVLTARGIHEFAAEPPLWEVDANLRPEGKDGALVRTLESHLAYYDRWAKSWEFQALLKARPIAGDRKLGERYVAGVAPLVWSSASRANFVESVQRMRERVTDNIPPDGRIPVLHAPRDPA